MKKYIVILFVLLVQIISISCDNCDDSQPTTASYTNFEANLNGVNQVPSNASTATGTAKLIYNNLTNTFKVTVTHSLTTVTAGQIYISNADTNKTTINTFTNVSSPFTYTSAKLTPEQKADLHSNRYYINLSSSTFPDGEIRGQLITN
ncbi:MULTISPECIES: CHRD domain-containing protein [unclassified Flavobacterium]|uniref:CHRD domain-containing protein n=1 Tax=unclassified Flavobacterium TaxID=196869 RepID=UPI003F9241F6